MLKEIGSNFWINPSDEFDYSHEITPEEFGITGSDYAWLSTGRSAISLAIETIEQRNPSVHKIVMVPPFTCETVLEPFLKAGYAVNTFTVSSKLCMEGKLLFEETKASGAGILILHRYFGFDTMPNMKDAISKIRDLGVIVIEDRTQCLYSDIKPLNADFFVGSIRKWHGVPDGGFVVCEEGSINQKPLNCDEKLETAKIDASYAKFRYLFENTGKKEDFLKKYRSAENILDHQSLKYKIGSFSYAMQASLNVKELRTKRKNNYTILVEGLKDIKDIKLVFPKLEEEVVPLYCPIIVEDRSEVQRVLCENAIFAPIIWPKSEVLSNVCNAAEQLYRNMLCIPMDQRYDARDMAKIITCLRNYYDKDNTDLKAGWMDWATLEPYKSQLIDLELELMIKYHYPDWDIPRTYPEERVEALKEHMEKGNTFFWGVTKGDILVGYYWAYTVPFIHKKRWVLRSLLIQSEFQKHGFGKMAVNEGLKKAREVGCDEAVTEYVPWNTSAARTYELAGYKVSRIEVVKKIGAIEMDESKKSENLGGGAIIVRLFTPELCDLYKNVLATYYYKNVKNCSCTETFTEADALEKIGDLKAYVIDGKAIVYGAFCEKQLIAYIWSYRHQFREEDRMYISEIYVDAEWRSFGIGKRLLNAVEKEAVNEKIEALYIHAEADNTRAIRLYEREGFRLERIQLRKALGKED